MSICNNIIFIPIIICTLAYMYIRVQNSESEVFYVKINCPEINKSAAKLDNIHQL